ncbi:ftsL_broad, cell division protein FtsL [Candidatus Pelagibacterales bacterium]|jgi:cell division protein FtsL
MREKIAIILFIVIFGTVCVSYIKNKTRDVEKEILKLKEEQENLVEKLKSEKLENNYLASPERVKKLAKLHLSPDYIEMDKNNFRYLNEK